MPNSPPEDNGRKDAPSQEEYAQLRRAEEALRETPQAKQETTANAVGIEQDVAQKYLRYTGMGMQFLFTLALPMAGGWWLDTKLGLLPKTPAFIIAGALLGMAGAMWGVIRAVSRMEGTEKKGRL